MRIIKDGAVVAELRNSPKDFDGESRGGIVSVFTGKDDVKLARYTDYRRAHEVLHAIHEAYFADVEEFVLPEE